MFRKYALPIARVLAIWLGVAGELGGQVYFGDFSVDATLAGMGAALAGALSWRSQQSPRLHLIVVTCCAAALAGVALEAMTYYRELDIPGNNFAWGLRGPFVAALLLIGYDSLAALRHTAIPRK
jgi:hypothetical protein